MKSTVALLAATFSISAFAQTSAVELPKDAATSTLQIPETKSSRISARGLRVGAWFPNLNTKIGGGAAHRIDRTFGVTAGYASLPVRKLGWIANVGLFEMTEYERSITGGSKEDSATLAKLDANLAFAITENFYFKAGGNVSGFTQTDNKDNFDPGFGYQAGLGAQLNSHLGIEVGWINMVQYGTDNVRGQEFKATGADVGITGTF
jgi:hypothetical protein